MSISENDGDLTQLGGNLQNCGDDLLKLRGRVHSIETLGALDGPGIRTVVFLSGCPMRCKYCHNPDSWNALCGEEKSVEEIKEFALRYKNYYGKTGGVTLSGGEPMYQAEFCAGLIAALKKENINVAIDTGGSVFEPQILQAADLIILDIKHTDAEGFLNLTGVKMDNLLKTLEYLKTNKLRFWVRQVIVSGITDSEENILKLREMAAGAEKIELLPYHGLGEHKYEKLGIDYPLKGATAPAKEVMQRLNYLLTVKY